MTGKTPNTITNDSAYIEAMQAISKIRGFVTQNCITCENFNAETELCQVWAVRPPARVIAGYTTEPCPEHLFIPF